MVKFLHTADWQIGMKAAHVGAIGQRVREQRLDSARRVVEAANEQAADFIIVAGDTFEDNAVDRVLVQKVADILGKFFGPVYIISGNHDPLVPGSVWEHAAWNSHDNLHVISEAQRIERDDCTIYPCPLFEKHGLADPTAWIEASDNPMISIGIGHGTVEGVSQTETDFPIARNAAARSGLDYLGLGHWHSYAAYPDADENVRMAYSGTHETTKFGERDSGNALLVEIEDRHSPPVINAISTGGLVWKVLNENVAEEGDLNRVRESIAAIADPENTLVDLRLTGLLQHGDQPLLPQIEDVLQSRFLFSRMSTEGLHPSPDDDRWIESLPAGYLQSVARRLQTLSDPTYFDDRPTDAPPEIAVRALLELYQIAQEEQA